MRYTTYAKPLSLVFTLLVTGCATTYNVVQDEDVLDRSDCSITQETNLVEKSGKDSRLVATKQAFVGFDSNCAKHEKASQEEKSLHEIKMAKIKAASEILVISFQSDFNDGKKSEYLQRILSNLSSDDPDWKVAQEKALATQGVTQDDIIRAEVIDLIYKSQNGDTLTKRAALSEVLNIHRREKYPERHDVPRQIVEKELAEQKLTVADIQQQFSQTNTTTLSGCHPSENKNNGKMVFVCN